MLRSGVLTDELSGLVLASCSSDVRDGETALRLPSDFADGSLALLTWLMTCSSAAEALAAVADEDEDDPVFEVALAICLLDLHALESRWSVSIRVNGNGLHRHIIADSPCTRPCRSRRVRARGFFSSCSTASILRSSSTASSCLSGTAACISYSRYCCFGLIFARDDCTNDG